MSESASTRLTLPLFPLGSVLYPGLVLPLQIFEERYRQLVADLLAGPEPRKFGVIAIRHGRETGIGGVSELYATGCTAVVQRAERHGHRPALDFAEAVRLLSVAEDEAATALIQLLVRDGDDGGAG